MSAPEVRIREQLRLPLERPVADAAFVVSDSNAEAVRTLAWLIDEAQRAGIEELRKAAFGAIPAYVRGCAELHITPASVPEGASRPQRRRGGGSLQALRGGLASAAG